MLNKTTITLLIASVCCLSLLSSTATAASLITSDQKTVFWTINKTGVEAVLNVTIPIDDNEHIQICVEKPTAEEIATLRTVYKLNELKAIPIELISELTENTDIFITKKSLDFTTTDTQYCLTVWWTKPPINTNIKIGKNSIVVSSQRFSSSYYGTQLCRYTDGTLYFAYVDSSSDPGIAYSENDGVDWLDGYDTATTARFAICVPETYPTDYMGYIYEYDTTYDTVRGRYVNRTIYKGGYTDELLTDASQSLSSILVTVSDYWDNPVIAAKDTDSYIYIRQYSEAQVANADRLYQLAKNGLTSIVGSNGLSIYGFYDYTTGRPTVLTFNTTVQNTYEISSSAGYYPSLISTSNGSIIALLEDGSSTNGYDHLIYRSNDNGATWTLTETFADTTSGLLHRALGRDADDNIYVILLVASSKDFLIYLSQDNGDTWTLEEDSTLNTNYFSMQGDQNSYPDYNLVQDPINIGYWNSTANVYFKTYDVISAASSCDCPGSGSAWVWDFTDNCDIDSDCTGITAITCTAGTSANYINIKANVECDSYTCDTDGQVRIYPTGNWQIDG